MASFLTQERFPRLWLLFQHVFGATRAKKRLALEYLGDYKSVLEIGCSMGIVSPAFAQFDDVTYLGIDIDRQAIEFARKRFAHLKNLEFDCIDLHELVRRGCTFDYVLFANILHHADDEMSVDLLSTAAKLVSDSGNLIIMEPDILHPDDTFLVRQLYKLERGQFRRPQKGYEKLINDAGLEVENCSSHKVSIDSLPGVTSGRLLMFSARHA